ncbi:adenylosuccinate lyase family protein [Methylobacterium sp. J-030]|uniref:class-II fumarase/aspartase family protein n=1 Tax=Methylobacterium sp. J-030 TaxID=2836627 RepID=UPI001FBB5213|nr:adenylosuccinate lyase family protein [Methylobacterium sp. J-030]MCJ2067961.1 adenylosuccinate lyase family protein [Methylobacterium sp. J-030]
MNPNAGIIDSSIYRAIFGSTAMRATWSDEARIQRYLDVERALAETQAELGIIPAEAAAEIARHCHVGEFNFDVLRQATEHIGYPVLPVVEQLVALCADGLGQWCHWGATTQDITDTATVLQIASTLDYADAKLVEIGDHLAGVASTYRDTPMVGRSNLQQAIPMTFGYKAAVWLAGIERCLERSAQLRPRVLMGEFGGAVGTLASLGNHGLAVQEGVCARLGLATPPIAWHTVRDTIAETGVFLALTCGQIEKIAFDIKIMAATEIGEVQEPDGGGGRGASSTMPQKRNPISCAYITGCTAVVRQHAAALLTAQAADFERATGPWEIEWIALPEIACLAGGILDQAAFLLGGLVVHPDAMARNLRLTDGLVNTEAVMMALAPKLGRQAAHDVLSEIARDVAAGKGRLIDLLSADKSIAAILTRSELEHLLDPCAYLGASGEMADRVLARRDAC